MSQAADSIPIFPLPNVVLFPGIQAPLHIFEPRYRQMIDDATAGDRRIGMVVVRPEHVDQMLRDPPIYSIGCAGVITSCQKLPDGRYNIVLLGSRRFRITAEMERSERRLYRIAEIVSLEDTSSPDEVPRIAALRSRVTELLGDLRTAENTQHAVRAAADKLGQLDDDHFTNALCNALDLQPRDKQQLLEADAVVTRLERLVGLLEFRLAENSVAGVPGSNALH